MAKQTAHLRYTNNLAGTKASAGHIADAEPGIETEAACEMARKLDRLLSQSSLIRATVVSLSTSGTRPRKARERMAWL
jgi:hypothetical protein